MKRPAQYTLDRPNDTKTPKLNNTQLTELANNIFSNEGISDIKFNLTDRLTESKYILNLRRVSHWYCKAVDQCLTKTLNERYKSEDYIRKGFHILKPAQTLNGTARCLTADLQQALAFYFHAQRNREQDACLAFIKLFDSHLESFKSDCQESGFQFSYNEGEKIFEFKFDQLQIKVNTPFSAYLFTHFLNRYLTSKQFNSFIFEAPNNNALMDPIIGFLKLYKSFNSVTGIVEEIILKLLRLIEIKHSEVAVLEKIAQIKSALIVLQKILEHGLIDKPLAIKFHLIEKIAPCLSVSTVSGKLIVLSSLARCAELGLINSDLLIKFPLVEKIAASLLNIDKNVRSEALSCLKKFAKAGLINPALVFDLVEKIAGSFSDVESRVRYEAWTCMGTFVEKGLIDSSLLEKFKLIEKISSQLPSPGTLYCLMECANKNLINNVHLMYLDLNGKLASFLSNTDRLVQNEAFSCMSMFAKKGLISLYYLKDLNLIETIASFLSSNDVVLQRHALYCMSCFAEQGLIDLSSVTNHNLIEKITSLLPQVQALFCLKTFANRDLIDQYLVIKLQLVEKMASRLTSPFLEDAICTIACLLKFLEKGLIDRSLITTLNLLTETIIRFDFYLLKKDYWQCGAALVCLQKLAENGFIDPSTVTKHNLVEKIRSFLSITEHNVTHASSCLKAFEDKGLINDKMK